MSLVALVALVALVCPAGCGGGGDDRERTGEEGGVEPPGDPEGEATITPLARRSVEIYFPSTTDDGLVSEFREIFDTATPGDQIKQIVADLISGPTTDEATKALPGGTRLRQVYVLDDGTAWLDFSSELTDGIGGGSMKELLVVYAVVNSVVANVPQVRKVGILVSGRPVETLNGHVHLLNPLTPNFSLILGSTTVARRHPAATRD